MKTSLHARNGVGSLQLSFGCAVEMASHQIRLFCHISHTSPMGGLPYGCGRWTIYASRCTVNLHVPSPHVSLQGLCRSHNVEWTLCMRCNTPCMGSAHLNPVALRTLTQFALFCRHHSGCSAGIPMAHGLCHQWLGHRQRLRQYQMDTQKVRTWPLPLKRVSYQGLCSLE